MKYQIKNKKFYELENFENMNNLTNHLKKNHADLTQKTKEMTVGGKTNIIKKARHEGEWTNSPDFFYNLGNNWIGGWHNEDQWFNYALIYKGEYLPHVSEKLKQLIGPEKNIKNINIGGFSWLIPNGVIKPHKDVETTISNNRLAYHYVIFGTGTLDVDGVKKKQIPTNTIIFDSGFEHSVVNDSEHRVIFYADFSIT